MAVYIAGMKRVAPVAAVAFFLLWLPAHLNAADKKQVHILEIARAVMQKAPDGDMVVWMATNPRTRKVAQIREDPRVTLYCFDDEGLSYVSIQGRAELVDDPKVKKKHWDPAWAEFYPNKEHLLIRVEPMSLELISIEYGIDFDDPVTWKPPSVRFPEN